MNPGWPQVPYLTGRVKGQKQGSPFHKGLRENLPDMLPSNAGQGSIICRVGSVAALRQDEVAHIDDDTCRMV